MKKLNSRTINKRIQKLYDRYHSIIANAKVGFYHMSCGTNEEKEYENLIGTNKQLFCALCWIYDCNLHQQPESTFDSPQCYNVKEYLKTYRTIFRVVDIAKLMEISPEPLYRDLPKACKSLMEKVIEIKQPNGDWEMFNIISYAKYRKKEGSILLEINEKASPYLFVNYYKLLYV